ncbi:metal ABC transporter substrate-binding protein [Bdellovibrio bacteriovorus]|uniref:metal ABC transporter substrate-binding protein n=1 Tax=Bdellovibrio bacteriovorus TaxID=959 RepID=UPI0021D1DCEB|nr:metal ABC transporter substrate-binding protein [Bdellovibrio bacteriovorus]UXR64287.1 metal ABC transporter substrate-binding protein [Bdellovibrio bacteriovorus]
MKYLICAFFSLALAAEAKIKVVTTTPDIAEVVRAIGQDQVEVQSLLSGSEDPHFAEARPDYILKVNRADIVCAMGLELEIGWLPKVLGKSGNSTVQEGGPGSCFLGKSVTPLDVPKGIIDRSLGDVHAHGNPHFNLDPLKLAEGAQEVVRVLSVAAPSQAPVFQKNYDTFKKSMTDLHAQVAKNLPKVKVMEYHKEFTYFFSSYGLESAGSLEEKPGMPPSAARMAVAAKMAKEQNVKILLASPSAPHKTLERFQELSGVKVVTVPSYVQNKGQANSIEALQKILGKSFE